MEGITERLFHSSKDGYDYLLRKVSGKSGETTTLYQLNKFDSFGAIKKVPVLEKSIEPTFVSRHSILIGARSSVDRVNGNLLKAEIFELAGKLGMDIDIPPKNKLYNAIKINEPGAELNLLVRDGEIKFITKEGYCFEPRDFDKLTPFAKKWTKKFLQMIAKAI